MRSQSPAGRAAGDTWGRIHKGSTKGHRLTGSCDSSADRASLIQEGRGDGACMSEGGSHFVQEGVRWQDLGNFKTPPAAEDGASPRFSCLRGAGVPSTRACLRWRRPLSGSSHAGEAKDSRPAPSEHERAAGFGPRLVNLDLAGVEHGHLARKLRVAVRAAEVRRRWAEAKEGLVVHLEGRGRVGAGKGSRGSAARAESFPCKRFCFRRVCTKTNPPSPPRVKPHGARAVLFRVNDSV